MTTITDEHRQRAREEARAILAAVLADTPAPRRVRRASAPRRQRTANPKTGINAKVSRAEVKRLHLEEGLGVMEISRRLGVHRTTVTTALKEAGVERKPNTRWEKCARGHDMKETWRPNRKGKGGGYCIECRRLWDRNDKRSKYVPKAERE